eukprot:SAG11_NODE_1253_length_5385_cov_1.942679_10_plen_71_part_00
MVGQPCRWIHYKDFVCKCLSLYILPVVYSPEPEKIYRVRFGTKVDISRFVWMPQHCTCVHWRILYYCRTF